MTAPNPSTYPDTDSVGSEDAPPTATRPAVTVVVPTRNERGNIEPLVRRLQAAFPAGEAAVVFVDDSDDGTAEEVERVASCHAIDVHLIHRPPGEREGALGGAVLCGLRATTSAWVVVMDADLQHPPELAPLLVAKARLIDADVVVASRHAPGGDEGGLSGRTRVVVSRSSIALSKALFPRRLAGISDPMSGFYVVRRERLDLDRLRPQGFKILLETLARHQGLTRAEIPFVFGERHSGTSKASLREGLVFVRQLARLRLAAATRPRPGVVRRGLGFATVGVSGLAVNTAALWALADHHVLAVQYLLAAVLATQVSSTWNFTLVDSLVYRGPKRGTRLGRYLGFMGMSNAVLVVRVPILALLVGVLGLHYLLANLLTLLLGFLVRFGSQERLTLMENSYV